jgi:hypothetical protein
MGAKNAGARRSIRGMQTDSRPYPSRVEEPKMLILILRIMTIWTGVSIVGALMLGRLLREPSPARARRKRFLMPASVVLQFGVESRK